MTPPMALTLHQPWASLVALGVKTIETRSWATKYRGPLLIHAGASMTRAQRSIAYADPIGGALNAAGVMLGGDCAALPLGAIVASCTLADVVPIDRIHWINQADASPTGPGWQWLTQQIEGLTEGPRSTLGIHEDQRPYGDFTPGRFAWLLEDVKATTERCPACWGKGAWWAGNLTGTGPTSVDRYRVKCPTCAGRGSCDSIPAKGHHRLWKWTP